MSTRLALCTALLCLVLAALPCAADDHSFVDVYTTSFDAPGESELALHTAADHGQDRVEGSAWGNRLELEHTFSDRFTGALYLNYLQDRSLSASPHFDGPSLEAIWKTARPRARGVETALYLEARENGEEFELEPRIIVAHVHGKTRAALNAVGEFEFQHENESGEEAERSVALAGGLSRRVGQRWSLGVEGRLDQSVAAGERAPRALFLGPTVGLAAGGLSLALSWQPQLAGAPSPRGGLELADFPRARYRLVVGADL